MDQKVVEAIRETWTKLAPAEKWRGQQTTWTATDLWSLSGLIFEAQPAAVVIAGGLTPGAGLAVYVGDLLDLNKRGKVLAMEEMSRERYWFLPEHRRVQYLPHHPLSEKGLEAAQRFTLGADPVVLLAESANVIDDPLSEVVSIYGHLVTGGGWRPGSDRWVEDVARDPMGLSQRSWLRRFPA